MGIIRHSNGTFSLVDTVHSRTSHSVFKSITQVHRILPNTTRFASSHFNPSLGCLSTTAPKTPSVFSAKLMAGPSLDDFVTDNVDAEGQGASRITLGNTSQ
ncbi:hypothetical protein FRC12_011455 [Ceratobasidium sp. 428]|nr:hypothetical protein FRC12_011455 [Ceratobasidium sp. 428]